MEQRLFPTMEQRFLFPTRALFLFLARIWFLLVVYFLLCLGNTIFADTEEIFNITEIEIASIYEQPHEGDKMKIYGNNFGTEKKDVTINLHGKDYKITDINEREIIVKIKKDMQSGLLYVKKKVKKNNKTVTLETNRVSVDLKEPQVIQMEAGRGLKGGEILEISGNNLEEALFWCDVHEFEFQGEKTEEKVYLVIPNKFLDCEFEVKNNGFVFNTKQKFKITPTLELYSLKLEKNHFVAVGKGFYEYRDQIEKIKLVIKGKEIATIDYLSDSEINFKKTVVPAWGQAFLRVNDISFPPIHYEFDVEIDKVTAVKGPFLTEEGFWYEVHASDWITDITRSGKIKMNNKVLTGKKDGLKMIVTTKNLPPQKMVWWVEKEGLTGEVFKYNYAADFSPELTQISSVYDLDNSGGRIKIFGKNLAPKDSLRVYSSVGKDLKIKNWQKEERESTYSFTTLLPHKPDHKKHSLYVSNKYGKSNVVYFEVPAAKLQSFYPEPKIKKILFLYGAFSGEEIVIQGFNLEHVMAVRIGEEIVKVKQVAEEEVKAIIPRNITGEIALTVMDKKRQESNKWKIEVFAPPVSREVSIAFHDTKGVVDSYEDFKQVVSFEVLNTREEGVLALEFSFPCLENCDYLMPFTEFSLWKVDENLKEKEVKDLKFAFEGREHRLSIGNLTAKVSLEPQVYSLKVKISNADLNYETRKVLVSSAVLQGEEDNIVLKKDNTEGIVYIQAEWAKQSFCKKLEEKEWTDCLEDVYEMPEDDLIENNGFTVGEIEEEEIVKVVPPVKQELEMNFKDIDEEDWFFPYVEDLFLRGIINGYADLRFLPGGNLNRAELLKMILAARGESWGTYATVHFADTEKHWSRDLLEYALEQNYIKPSKNFQPLKSVTRAETVKMICKMFDFIKVQETDTHFLDLKKHWSKDYVMAVYDLGIIKGVSDAKFSPDALITRAEFSKILSRVLVILEA